MISSSTTICFWPTNYQPGTSTSQKNKMNVKLAAETLSTSVADAIENLREDKKIPEFEGSEATCKFISIIDKLFDICNSQSSIESYSKATIS